jgi:hypothetical protein
MLLLCKILVADAVLTGLLIAVVGLLLRTRQHSKGLTQ